MASASACSRSANAPSRSSITRLTAAMPEQRPAALGVVRRGVERRLMRAQRLRHGAEMLEQLAAQGGQRKALGGATERKRQASVDQSERLLVAVLARLLARRRQIGRRSTRVLGTIEVLGVQRQVALRKPRGSPPMQLAPPGLEQRVVDGIADQRVREQELVARRAHEKALDQGGAVVARVAPRAWRSASSAKRWPNTAAACTACLSGAVKWSRRACTRLCTDPGTRGLGASSAWRSSCSRNSGLPAARSMHRLGEVAVGLEISLGERGGLRRAQRPEIDGHERTAAGAGAPGVVERVALDPRGHDQDGAARGRRVGKARQVIEGGRSAQCTSSTASRRGAACWPGAPARPPSRARRGCASRCPWRRRARAARSAAAGRADR